MINIGEKLALDAYKDFCELQQGLIEQLTRTIAVMANPQVSFRSRPLPKTEVEEDREFMERSPVDPAEVQELLREAKFFSDTVQTP